MYTDTERNGEICRLYKEGRSVQEISEMYGLEIDTVFDVLRENGLKRASKTPWYINNLGLNQEQFEQKVVDEYKSGKKMTAIAEELGAKIVSVRKILRDQGVSPSGKLEKQGIYSVEERTNRILELRKKGLTYDQIVDEIGVCKSIVQRTCKRSGVNAELKQQKWTDLEAEVLRLYKEGNCASTIKRILHVDYPEVRDILEKNGFSPSHRQQEVNERNARIRELVNQGKTVPEICEEIQINKFTLYHIVARIKSEKNQEAFVQPAFQPNRFGF